MKKAGKSNKVIMDPRYQNVSRPRLGGNGIRMMNCTVSTQSVGNNILIVKDGYLK